MAKILSLCIGVSYCFVLAHSGSRYAVFDPLRPFVSPRRKVCTGWIAVIRLRANLLAAGRERALGKEILSQRQKILIAGQFEFRLVTLTGRKPPRAFLAFAVGPAGAFPATIAPFPNGPDQSAARGPGHGTHATPMPARPATRERTQGAASLAALIGALVPCGGGIPLKTNRRRAS
jgi:hypothetical protein